MLRSEVKGCISVSYLLVLRCRFLIGCFVLIAPIWLQAAEPLSVCSVLDNPAKYAGALVTLRGGLQGGRRHGLYLVESPSGSQCVSLSQFGPDVAALVKLEGYVKGSEIEGGGVGFETGQGQIRKMQERLDSIKGLDNVQLIVTIRGLVRIKGPFMIERTAGGGYWGSGYGEQGWAPAQLVVKSVLDSVIVPTNRLNPK